MHVCLELLLSVNLLFRCVVLCTAQRMDVDALMDMAKFPSSCLIHSPSAAPHIYKRAFFCFCSFCLANATRFML